MPVHTLAPSKPASAPAIEPTQPPPKPPRTRAASSAPPERQELVKERPALGGCEIVLHRVRLTRQFHCVHRGDFLRREHLTQNRRLLPDERFGTDLT
jgi:hypothetical protein